MGIVSIYEKIHRFAPEKYSKDLKGQKIDEKPR
jgi:hypothetical protein